MVEEPQFLLEPVHAGRHSAEHFEERLHAPGAEAQLLDERQRLGPIAAEAQPRRPGLVGAGALVDEDAEVGLAPLDESHERGEVVRHPRLDLFLREPLGERHLDCAVEGELPFVDALEGVDGRLHRPRTAEDRAPEPLSGDLDPLCQRDLFRPRQERNLGHLGQIHPDRIVAGVGRRAGDRLVASGRRLGLRRRALDGRHDRRGGLVEEIDPLFLEGDKQGVDLLGVNGLVREVGIDLIEGQVALGTAGGDEGGQFVVLSRHRSCRLEGEDVRPGLGGDVDTPVDGCTDVGLPRRRIVGVRCP